MRKKKAIKRILFVCYANLIRSPIAERLFRSTLEQEGVKGIFVSSAGTRDFHGASPFEETIEVAREFGIDLSEHRSQILDLQTVEKADLIIAMDRFNRSDIEAVFPSARGKVKLLGDYFPPPHQGEDIDDPVGAPPAVLKQCIQYIREGIEGLVSECGGKSVA